MTRAASHVPRPFTIPTRTKKRIRRYDPPAPRGAVVSAERVPNPIQPSLVVQRCPTCREFFTEADRAFGACHRDGHPYLAPRNA